VADPTITTFRDTLRRICPPWLARGNAEKYVYTFGLHLDILGDAVVAAIKLRFPNAYSAESLPLLGRDRKIRRGIGETDATYATRMRRWLDDHARRGGPYAMLAQIFAHYATAPFLVELVSRKGQRHAMAIDGSVTRSEISFEPDDRPDLWSRWWLYYHWPTAVAADGVWSDPGVWSDGGVWDSSLTVAEVEDLKLIPTEWNAAHTTGTLVVLSPDAELWDYPVGTWDEPGGIWGEIPAGIAQIRIEN
jgi:hypothetical protein